MSDAGSAEAPAIGLYGGSFDPVHLGHLRTALEVSQLLGLDEVRFTPSGQPPHRRSPRAPASLRLLMLQAAVADVDGFAVDPRELEREGPSYTIDTLVSLREEQPRATLVVILGMDAYLGLGDWHRSRELLDYAHFIVAHRPGWEPPAAADIGWLADRLTRSEEDLRTGSGRVLLHAVTPLDIASSDIRELIAARGDPRFLVPDSVWQILQRTHCYADKEPHTRQA
ncbi:MAG: nicotinate-nucleotide adenylyltransferase [Gammaproteobacteria bacterium]